MHQCLLAPQHLVHENQTSIGKVTASDQEGDDITFSISGSEIQITSDGVLSLL